MQYYEKRETEKEKLEREEEKDKAQRHGWGVRK